MNARAREHARLVALDNGIELLEASFDRHVYEKHMHEAYAVGVTLRGVQRFWCRGRTNDSVAQHLMVIGPGEVHDGQSGAPGGYEYRMLYLPIRTVEEVLRETYARTTMSIDGSSPLIRDAELTASLNRAWSALCARELLAGEELLGRVLVTLGSRAHRLPLPRNQAVHRRALLLVRDYLHAHLDSTVRVTELATLASMSRFQLTRQFQRAFGLPLHAYHLQARLTEAKHRLRRGDAIAGVAADLGFADQSHFHRRFRGFFGVTPDTWRRSGPLHGDPIRDAQR